MKGRGLALIAMLAGCDGVFGLHELHVPMDKDGGIDAPIDAPDGLYFQTAGGANGENTNALTFPMTVPPAESQVMVVFVALGSSCQSSIPSVASVTFMGVMGTTPGEVLGTPCAAAGARSQIWLFSSPAPGTHDVVITLSGTAGSAHADAMVFANVDLAMPVRSVGGTKSAGTSSVLTLQSSDGDLVASFVAQGHGINAPGSNATLRKLQNVNANTSLNNSAVSTIPGMTQTLDATWTFTATDQWQALAISLRPAPN